MPKKKRAVHARGAVVAAPVGASAASAPPYASIGPSLAGDGDLAAEKQRARRALHDANGVIADIKAETAWLAPAQLERALWVQLTVAVLTEVALVLDHEVTARTMFFAVFPIAWTARACVARLSLSLTAKNPIMSVADRRRLAKTHPLRILVVARVLIASVGAIALAAASVTFRAELFAAEWAVIVAVVAVLEVAQLRAMIRADGQQTATAVVAATVEAFGMVHLFATYTTDTSNLIVDHLARRLTAVTAATHTFVVLSAIYVLEHVTTHHRAEFRSDRQKSAELMTRLREAYRDPKDPSKETESASKRRKRAARAKLAAATVSADALEGTGTAALLAASPSRWQRPSILLGLLLALQTLLLVGLLALVSTAVLARESMSALVLGSAHVTWTLLRLKQSLSVSE